MPDILLNKRLFASLLKFLFGAFLLLKVYRGFYGGVGSQGGIWNFIQLFFVVTGFTLCFSHLKAFFSNKAIFLFLFVFFYMWFASFFPFIVNGNYTIPSIFFFLLKPYGFFVFMCFLYCGIQLNLKDSKYPMMILFIILSALVVYSMLKYRVLFIFDEKGAVADVYYLLGLLPYMFVVSKKLKIFFFLLTFFAIMLTGKRAGFLCIAIIFVLNFLSTIQYEPKIKKYLFFITIVSVFVFAQEFIVSYFNLDIFSRLEKLNSDGGSGRSFRWNLIWNAFYYESNPFQFLFGHGSGSCISLVGHAHNDFIEILYDYGLVLFLLYVAFYIFLIKDAIVMKIKGYPYVREFTSTIVVMLFLAMFSFFAIDCMYIISTSFCLGIFYADWYKFQNGLTDDSIKFK